MCPRRGEGVGHRAGNYAAGVHPDSVGPIDRSAVHVENAASTCSEIALALHDGGVEVHWPADETFSGTVNAEGDQVRTQVHDVADSYDLVLRVQVADGGLYLHPTPAGEAGIRKARRAAGQPVVGAREKLRTSRV